MAIANSPTRMTSSDAPASGAVTRARADIAPLLESRCRAYSDAVARLERFARHDSVQVLLVGESGTGKSIFAQHLHDCSARTARVFHRVALSAIADSLATSDLFGHLQGAFTDARSKRAGHFVSAHGGTLFLDEIGKASPAVQYALLDAVERQEIAPVGSDRSMRIDVRLVAATNVPLVTLVEQGKFLPDLAARLDGFAVRIPPLRERRNDVALLVAHLVDVHAPQLGYRKPPTFDTDLMQALTDAAWPGNVRELDITVRRLLVEGEGAPIITLANCTDSLSYLRPSKRSATIAEEVVAELKRVRNVTAVARKFRISRTTVYSYLQGARAAADSAS